MNLRDLTAKGRGIKAEQHSEQRGGRLTFPSQTTAAVEPPNLNARAVIRRTLTVPGKKSTQNGPMLRTAGVSGKRFAHDTAQQRTGAPDHR